MPLWPEALQPPNLLLLACLLLLPLLHLMSALSDPGFVPIGMCVWGGGGREGRGLVTSVLHLTAALSDPGLIPIGMCVRGGRGTGAYSCVFFI